ncbi:MAG: methyltransferase domain-containing protein [Oceanospirillaceae bacterium]|nr:methyltransferase domain-containing protein [Oceanospirillaceae bacterium]
MNSKLDQGVASGPAEVYEHRFVPALFAQWGPIMADCAAIGPGQRVLDVACGTGVLAIAAEGRVGAGGEVVGLDASPEMLQVARRKSSAVDWRKGVAEALPFPDQCFDAVVSQFGLMLFEDPVAALREMWRVLRPGGRLAVAVCDDVERSPGYRQLALLLDDLFGAQVADAFRTPFRLGDAALLHELCDQAGIVGSAIERRCGEVRFASVDALVSTERACVWTLGGMLDDAQFARLREEADAAFESFCAADGRVRFEMPALIITATAARAADGAPD